MKLITNQKNVEYLSGFTGSHAFLLIGKNKNYLFTDGRYLGYALKLKDEKTRINFEVMEIKPDLNKVLNKITKGPVEFEANNLSVAKFAEWKKKFAGKKMAQINAKDSIEDIRAIKEEMEIKNIKKSQDINQKVLERIQKLLVPGVTELQIAWKIREIAHDFGIEELSFDPIVAFGKNSAIPHHQNTNAKLTDKDVILIDMGMKFNGYCSDMTRTFLPKKPSAEQMNIYSAVLSAQLKAIAKIKDGAKVKDIDLIARKEMGKYEEFFNHSLGHGLGIEIHESPRLSTLSKEILKENMIITVEPGIYLPGKFGVRIEDMGLVRKNGFTLFTSYPK
ncbi:MAG: aminopeptidase P family protein [Candidatus Gracilibacteria bacterium]